MDGGFVFILSGFYAMQQRSHIRIFLLYDMLPRNLQRTCDCISTFLIIVFAFFLVYGGYGEAKAKFLRWETFGTIFDPPIPSTLKPLVLLVVCLVAVQSLLNLINDWNKEPEVHTAADDIDEEEIERLKSSEEKSNGYWNYFASPTIRLNVVACYWHAPRHGFGYFSCSCIGYEI